MREHPLDTAQAFSTNLRNTFHSSRGGFQLEHHFVVAVAFRNRSLEIQSPRMSEGPQSREPTLFSLGNIKSHNLHHIVEGESRHTARRYLRQSVRLSYLCHRFIDPSGFLSYYRSFRTLTSAVATSLSLFRPRPRVPGSQNIART